MNLGLFIKNTRRAKGFTQKEFAEGICTQATISNLEGNRGIPSVQTLVALTDRISIDFNDLVEYLPAKNIKIEQFMETRELLRKKDYEELKKVLMKIKTPDDLTTFEVKEYRYLMGVVALYEEENNEEALYQFNVGLQEDSKQMTRMIETLTINGIGMAYFLNNEVEKATIYIKKSVSQMDEIMSENIQQVDLNDSVQIYSTAAMYYSYMKDYTNANNLYKKASDLQKKESELFGVDTIYYERGVNFAKMGDLSQAKKLFFIGLGLAEINTNKVLINQILQATKEFKLGPIQYEK
ncbi:helix-turn-helix domain-containing protein [Carnobacterium maltaromaticum]|uniref:helix-turn-helix domain-containing protein n=1 Tax=Carnobacterium maltaromaticum TaxID=2751 RepID=UPI00295E9DCF|nr:helix-turn-helix domain-containing protein [Carnobacterium maltaromaticum]